MKFYIKVLYLNIFALFFALFFALLLYLIYLRYFQDGIIILSLCLNVIKSKKYQKIVNNLVKKITRKLAIEICWVFSDYT